MMKDIAMSVILWEHIRVHSITAFADRLDRFESKIVDICERNRQLHEADLAIARRGEPGFADLEERTL